jgi:Flp pilus assembly protein TadG
MSAVRPASARRGERGQILVVAALAMVAIIGGVSLVIEAGNAYAHQRVAQNAVDSTANAGATVLAERLGGSTRSDTDVKNAMYAMATANELSGYGGHYTNVLGSLLQSDGTTTTNIKAAAAVGDGTIPPTAQGVQADGSLPFGTTFARVLGVTQFTASAEATAVAGALTGGVFLPVVFPVSMKNCDGTGTLVENLDAPWRMSNPPKKPPVYPDGQEWLVPLCKTGGGSFMILDLDPNKDCYEEVVNPTKKQFANFPVDIPVDNGNDCAKKVQQGIQDSGMTGKVVLIPICDGDCSTNGGSNGVYHVIRIAAFFLDYLSYSNNPNNSACQLTTSPNYGTNMKNIVDGNGSSSCMAGWFVRYVTKGPVGAGDVTNGQSIGVQLIK